jgi:large subunit ribosomal protein L1
MEIKNDAGGNLHTVVGKLSFDSKKLVENVEAMIAHVRRLKPQTSKGVYIKKVTLKASMTPGVLLAVS